MFYENISKMKKSARQKVDLLENSRIKYLVCSAMAGVYVGLGILLIFTIGGLLSPSPNTKIVMGISFAIALCLVLVAGGELFTGNNMIMTVGSLEKEVTWFDTLKIWLYSYVGNLLGSILIAYMFIESGLAKGSVAEFIIKVSSAKMAGNFNELFVRGILCNMLVCLAIWSYFKLKDETAKILMVFLCLFAFITSGYEHSIANMTLLSVGIMIPGSQLTVSGFVNNLIPVTLGNMVGGSIIIGYSYWLISSSRK